MTRFGSSAASTRAALPPGLSLPELEALERVLRIGIQEATAYGVDTTSAISTLAQIRALRASGARISCEGLRELLSLREAARRAGVPEATVRGWLRRTELRPVGRRITRRGEQLLWTAEDVVEAAERLRR